jgi:signal peptidase II
MAIILFVSGATGNLLDRFLYGGVRDFIDFHVWPVFNLADTFLTLAVIVMLWVEFL